MSVKEPKIFQPISSIKILVCDTLKQQGIDPAPLCAVADLSMPDEKHLTKRDDTVKVVHLMQLAAQITGDDSFALQVASRLNITSLTYYGAEIIACSNLKAALLRGQNYAQLMAGSISYAVAKEHNRYVVRLFNHTDVEMLDVNLVLLYIAGGLQIGRSLSSTNVVPIEVRLQQTVPEDIEPYIALFGCPVIFGQTENSISLRAEDLNTPIATQNPRLSRLAQDLAMKDLSQMSSCSVAEEVCVLVESSLAEGEPKIAAIASSMGLSPRSLQRKLAAEKHTFAQLLDSTRKRMAHEMVLKQSEQIKNLAYDLGFSDQSNFNRAFKRWYSLSPTEYRRQFDYE